MRFLRFLLPIAAFAALVFPLKGWSDDYEPRSFAGPDGQTLPYRLLKPKEHQGKVPLVLFLHGAGERGDDNQSQLRHGAPLFAKPEVREKFPAYVVAPQCPKDQKWVDWDWSKSFVEMPKEPSAPMRLVIALLDSLTKEFADIDQDRLYVTGLSMGGYGTWDLLMRFPQRFAAAAPVCGGGDPHSAAAIAHVPIWTFHGDADPVVKVDLTRRMVEALKTAGGNPLYSEYPTVKHDSWTTAYQEPQLLPWVFAQRRGQKPVSFEQVAGHFAQPPSNFIPGEGPMQGGIFFRPLWQNRRAQWSKDAANDKGAVVFLGDSITQGWEKTLAADFPKLKVANRGISGDTTRGVLARLQEDVIAVHPKAVEILIGTNDIGLGAEPELVAKNVGTIIARLRASDAKLPIVLSRVMPSDPSKQRPPDKLQKLNALVDALATKDPLVIRVDTYGVFANEQGNAKKEEFPDLLHPNTAGYAKWKALLDPVFEKLNLASQSEK